jgi:hypothetical protein
VSAFGLSADTLVLGELPLTVGEAVCPGDLFFGSNLGHLGGVFLLQVRSGLVQFRSLIVRSGRT